MKRPIKFRGACVGNGTPVYGDLIHCYGEIYIDSWEVKPESVAQLVGCDKDGNEIYEGDIVTNFVGEEFTAEILDGVITSEGAVDYVGGVEVLKLKEVTS